MGNRAFGGSALGKPDNFARRVEPFDRADETIAPAREGFDKARLVGGITQRLPQFTDGNTEAFFEIDESVAAPEPLVKRLTGDELAGAFKQRGENLERLPLQPNLHPTLAELAGSEV